MVFISSNNFSTLESFDNENNCWIHKVEKKLLSPIDEEKYIGSKFLTSNDSTFSKININDEILLFTRFNDDIIFYGFTKVESVEVINEKLYDYYSNKIKIKIKRIKYFLEPVFIEDFYEDVSFVKNKDYYKRYFIQEYKQISSDDFKKISSHSISTGMFPIYFDEYSSNMKEFILDNCKSLYILLKNQKNYSQIEITEFISLLKLSLKGFGIDKDEEDLKRFYSRYAHELGFKHLPSRDPKKFVVLLTRSGEKKNFAYVSLE